MSWLLGIIAAVGWGGGAFLGVLYWRSRVEIRSLRQRVARGEQKLEWVREEFAGRLAGYERELEESRAIAQDAYLSKSRFFDAIDDRTREPLHTILGYLQLLERGMLLDRSSRESIGQIRRSTESLLALLEDILAIVHLDNRPLLLTPSIFPLKRFLESLEMTIQAGVLNKGLQVSFYLPEEVPVAIETDERKLRQILLAILDNAIKFTKRGRIIVRVGVADRSWLAEEEAEPTAPGNYSLLFEVEDTGIGIPPEKLEQIFETHRAIENRAGRLGLAIARRLARGMGGEIGIDSLVDRGTLVKVSIPVTAATQEAWWGIPGESGRILGLAPHQPEYRILVADDRPENRELLSNFLSPLGFQLKEASNGQETISIWSTWRPHLIWLDTRMPIMDGAEALQQIRHLEALGISPDRSTNEGKTVIIALVTGMVEEEASALLTLGCNDVLRKPFELEIVLEIIARHLGVRYLYETDPSVGEAATEDDDDMTTLPLADFPRSPSPVPTIRPRIPAGVLQGLSLRVMPREWIEEVYHQAGAGDSDRLLGAIAKIPQGYATLAAGLTALVEQYNFRKIREFSQEALASTVLADE
jgi:signal transduction histidine kinase/CheY-like chemotaxis protein